MRLNSVENSIDCQILALLTTIHFDFVESEIRNFFFQMEKATTETQENSEGNQKQAETQVSVINELRNGPKNSDNVQQNKKRKQANPDEIMTSAFKILKTSAERNQSVPTNSKSPDECETYGAFIGNKLRLYTPRTRSYVQHHFSQILFNADQGQYEYTPDQYYQGTYSGYGYSTTPSPAPSNTRYSGTDNSQQATGNFQQATDNSQQATNNSHETNRYFQQAVASPDSCHSQISDEFVDDFNDLL